MNQSERDLERFREQHRTTFATALSEIESGRKRSHWMWWIFPQVGGLGSTETSHVYAMKGLGEATAFLADETLGKNYAAIIAATRDQLVAGTSARVLFGATDARKLVSSATLFAAAARRLGPAFSKVAADCDAVVAAAIAQGVPPCEHTALILRRAGV